MLVAERLIFLLGRSDSGDGGTQLLWRRWVETAKTSFSVFLWAATTVAVTKSTAMCLSFPFVDIPTTVDLLDPAVPPTIKSVLTDIY